MKIFLFILLAISFNCYSADLKDTRVNGRLYVGSATASTSIQDNALVVDGNVGVGTATPDTDLSFTDKALFNWETTGNDNFQLGLDVGGATEAGYITIMEDTDMGNANRSPSGTSANPTLRIYSSDATQSGDYVDIFHDQTQSVVSSPSTNLALQGNSNVEIWGGTSAVGRYHYSTSTGGDIYGTRWDLDWDQITIATSDSVGNQYVFTNWDNIAKDHDHAKPTDPTFYVHSDLDPDTSNNQWGSLHHDQEDFIITTGANTGAGSAPTTDENGIVLAPRGTEKFRVDDDLVTTVNFIRDSASDYRRYYHLPLASFDPGASGATWTAADANNLCGWQLNAAAETLDFQSDVHADWDGASNVDVEVSFSILAASNENDTVDLQLIEYHKGVGDSSTSTQTLEVATNVGDGGGKADNTMFEMEFSIPYDTGGQEISAGDSFCFILNLETDTSEVDDIIITDISFYYNTTHVGIESGDT